GKVLRSRLPDLVHQEIWAWLIVHYAIAVLISRAAEAADIDPDRISFTRTLRLVRRTATGSADFPEHANPAAGRFRYGPRPRCWRSAAARQRVPALLLASLPAGCLPLAPPKR